MTDSTNQTSRHAQVSAVRQTTPCPRTTRRVVFIEHIAAAMTDDNRLDDEAFAALSNDEQTRYLDSLPYFDPDFDD